MIGHYINIPLERGIIGFDILEVFGGVVSKIKFVDNRRAPLENRDQWVELFSAIKRIIDVGGLISDISGFLY